MAAITYVIITLAAITYGIITLGRYNLPLSYGLKSITTIPSAAVAKTPRVKFVFDREAKRD
jgi:hypothetical protein